jgi:cytochrome c553
LVVATLLPLACSVSANEKDQIYSPIGEQNNYINNDNNSHDLGDEDCTTSKARYSMLPNGSGELNFEQVSYACIDSFDKEASLAAFESTVYPLLRENCASCHSTQGRGQAPLHSDSEVNLAHEYALTRVNFRHPEDSKLVSHVELYNHYCFGSSCADSGNQLLAAVESWADVVQDFVPEVPRGVAQNVTVSEEEVTQWIASDRANLSSDDASYMVYVSLHEMHNSGMAADRLNVARAALSKALNSTARWAPNIVNPIDINGMGMVYRFDIRSYWGYNKGVKSLIFGGSDDDIFFGDKTNLISHRFNFTSNVTEDPEFAQMVWARVQQGSIEAAEQGGNAANNTGFKDDYVELSQLVYTLTRPDVYNAIMAIPIYADELEDELEVVKTNGAGSYQFMAFKVGITIDSRQMFRATTSSGRYYWKSFDIFTGSGQEYPFFENPIPKFVTIVGGEDRNYSLLATLATPQIGSEPAGCNAQSTFGSYSICTQYTGTGGVQQHASETFWELPNGLQAYAIFGGLNQRRTDAFMFIVVDPRRQRAAVNNGGNPHGELRLNQAASCMGCHEDGMKRENNDLRDKLENGSLDAPWTSDASIVERVRELYPTTEETRQIIENDHIPFYEAMLQIREGMILGEDKNLYVEPIVNTFEWAQIYYGYPSTLAN